jgi:hypothetical protein
MKPPYIKSKNLPLVDSGRFRRSNSFSEGKQWRSQVQNSTPGLPLIVSPKSVKAVNQGRQSLVESKPEFRLPPLPRKNSVDFKH